MTPYVQPCNGCGGIGFINLDPADRNMGRRLCCMKCDGTGLAECKTRWVTNPFLLWLCFVEDLNRDVIREWYQPIEDEE